MTIRLVVTDLVADEGTVIVLQGMTLDGTDETWRFAADRRLALDIMYAIAGGEDVEVEVEAWQLTGMVR